MHPIHFSKTRNGAETAAGMGAPVRATATVAARPENFEDDTPGDTLKGASSDVRAVILNVGDLPQIVFIHSDSTLVEMDESLEVWTPKQDPDEDQRASVVGVFTVAAGLYFTRSNKERIVLVDHVVCGDGLYVVRKQVKVDHNVIEIVCPSGCNSKEIPFVFETWNQFTRLQHDAA